MGDINELYEEWKASGAKLLNEIEAEHDTVNARIEADRLYLHELKDKRREVKRRLGVEDQDPEEKPPIEPLRSGVVKMTRYEQHQVPVETRNGMNGTHGAVEIDATSSDMPPTIRDLIIQVVSELGPVRSKTVTEKVLELDPTVNAKSVGPYLTMLKGERVLTAKPCPDHASAFLWSLA